MALACLWLRITCIHICIAQTGELFRGKGLAQEKRTRQGLLQSIQTGRALKKLVSKAKPEEVERSFLLDDLVVDHVLWTICHCGMFLLLGGHDMRAALMTSMLSRRSVMQKGRGGGGGWDGSDEDSESSDEDSESSDSPDEDSGSSGEEEEELTEELASLALFSSAQDESKLFELEEEEFEETELARVPPVARPVPDAIPKFFSIQHPVSGVNTMSCL